MKNHTLIPLALVALLLIPIVTADITPADTRINHYSYSVIGRIAQGQRVHVNDTIDISGMGINMEGVAWYGKYGEYTDPQYIREFTPYPIDQYDFWLDPVIFKDRPGMWYQYDGTNATEKNGNTAAFYVIDSSIQEVPGNLLLPNVTETNVSPVITPAPILPEVYVSDYLLAIGDPLRIETGGPAKIWIFGRVDKLYDVEVSGVNVTGISLPASDFTNFEPGHYQLLIQQKGRNGAYDVRYLNNSIQYIDGWNGIKSEDLSGIQPMLALDRVQAMIAKTDDLSAVYDIEIQRPSITINSMDEVPIGTRASEFVGQPGLVTLMQVRGYSNTVMGSTISVVLDKDNKVPHDIKITTQDTKVVRNSIGDMGMYEVDVPMIWDDLALTTTAESMHVMTATGPFGERADANVPVEEMPADSFRPNASLKYIGEENPFHPNLTTAPPVTILVPEPGPTQTIIVTITPSPQEIDAAAKVKVDAQNEFWMEVGAVAVALIAITGIGWWVLSAWRRSKT